MTFVVRDMRNQVHHHLEYFNALTAAETAAVQIMNTIGIRWGRCDSSDDYLEYSEYPCIGSCRVYVRVYQKDCHTCKCSAVAVYETPAGYFCNECYVRKYHKEDAG